MPDCSFQSILVGEMFEEITCEHDIERLWLDGPRLGTILLQEFNAIAQVILRFAIEIHPQSNFRVGVVDEFTISTTKIQNFVAGFYPTGEELCYKYPPDLIPVFFKTAKS